MKVTGLRSPYDQVGGLFHFGRMLDKIRLHAAGKLPADYIENLGGGFDGRCCSFLHVEYKDIVARVKTGGTDEEILAWCFQNGHRPSKDELEMWNDFMRKRGWQDSASARLVERVQELDPRWAGKILTFFDFIDVDEGRPPHITS
jgi:gluconokinase